MKETWNYASAVVGMLLYLSTNTRTDITFAVSQVARFTTSPKQSHATAVKSIVRYLAGTINKGMVLRPTALMDINAYVDADFAGLYGQEPDDNIQAAQSRTGYVITIAKCPMLWKSQLQTEVALSTTHAEYVALSQCMRVIIPLTSLVKEVLQAVDSKLVVTTMFHSDVFEDNMGAYYLANNQRLTSRSKHFLTKYHFFWQAVREGVEGVEVKVSKIDTKLQNADYLTKGLPQEVFHANRQRVQGWIVTIDNKAYFVQDQLTKTAKGSAEEALSPTYERESCGPTRSEALGSKHSAKPGQRNAVEHDDLRNVSSPYSGHKCELKVRTTMSHGERGH